MIVWNPTKETVSTKMQGAWFTFKPEMRKHMDDDKCRFITENRKETGLVILPDAFDPASEGYVEAFDKTPEGQAILEEKRSEGINNLLAFHKDIIRNNQISLRRDLAKVNPEGDSSRLVLTEMSKGEQESLAIVARYQRDKKDANDAKLKELTGLLESVGPLGE